MSNLTILSKNIRTIENLYSLNDLHKASGKAKNHQLTNFIRQSSTQELMQEITSSSDLRSTINIQNGKGTWVCKELVYAYAMWISPKFHLQVIRAFDAMTTQQPAIQSGVTVVNGEQFLVLNQEQARHLHLMMNNVDALEQEEATTHQEITLLRNRLHTCEMMFREMNDQLDRFNSHQNLKLDRIRHFHLHKNFVFK